MWLIRFTFEYIESEYFYKCIIVAVANPLSKINIIKSSNIIIRILEQRIETFESNCR